jgi:hypothetical protein
MDSAVLALLVSEGVVRQGLRYGGYRQDDAARLAVEATARATMGRYADAWQALAQAQAARQVQAQHQERLARER